MGLERNSVQVSHAIHSTDDSHRHASNFLPVILAQSFFEMVSLRNSTPTKVRAETELFSILGMLPLSNLLCIVSHPYATLHITAISQRDFDFAVESSIAHISLSVSPDQIVDWACGVDWACASGDGFGVWLFGLWLCWALFLILFIK
ncbi:unnamed protein product [Prunus brigantina]